jgi:hypothetical protein
MEYEKQSIGGRVKERNIKRTKVRKERKKEVRFFR